MSKAALVLLLLISAAVAQAAEPAAKNADDDEAADQAPKNRDTSLKLAADGGSGYTDQKFNADYGVDTSLQLKASYTHSDSTGDVTTDTRAGADIKLNPDWNLTAMGIIQGEPNDIAGRGIDPGASWVMSSLWKGDLDTTLSLDVAWISYSQALSPSSPPPPGRIRRNIGRSISQAGTTLALSQDLPWSFSLDLSTTRYHYSTDPTLLAQAMENRKISLPGVDGLLGGFAQNSSSAELTYNFTDDLEAHASVSKSRLVLNNSLSRTNAAGASYKIASWTIGVDGSRSLSDGVSTQNVLGASLMYTF